MLKLLRKLWQLPSRLADIEQRLADLERSQQPVGNVTWKPPEFIFTLPLCDHEYPTPWLGTVPPTCEKCGEQASDYHVTY